MPSFIHSFIRMSSDIPALLQLTIVTSKIIIIIIEGLSLLQSIPPARGMVYLQYSKITVIPVFIINCLPSTLSYPTPGVQLQESRTLDGYTLRKLVSLSVLLVTSLL